MVKLFAKSVIQKQIIIVVKQKSEGKSTAWIETHQELRDHPKVKKLSRLMGWDYCHALGHLQYFWLWCLQHALDGDLRRYDDEQIAEAAGVAAADAKKFVEAMVNCGNGFDSIGNKVVSGFIDRKPFFKVHDWIDYAGRYLDLKYRIANPKMLSKIKKKHRPSKDCLKTDNLTLPDLTRPNLTRQGVDVNKKKCSNGVEVSSKAVQNQSKSTSASSLSGSKDFLGKEQENKVKLDKLVTGLGKDITNG